jgi:4-amino-4-deoxy-L-arabinose transferase and related glycosyltransferases of PMT family
MSLTATPAPTARSLTPAFDTLDTVSLPRVSARGSAGARLARWRRGTSGWLGEHRISVAVLLPLLIVTGVFHALNADGWPGRINDDEGTYEAQAFAMQHWHQIAHYTYWYDHPFGGWALIAAYNMLTDAPARHLSAVGAGREFMVVINLISCALLYALARRLGMRRRFAALAVIMFGLSPLALHYQRMVFLDSIAVMWVLAALVCATSRKRSVGAAVGAAACLAAAIWSKETSAVLLPGVYWCLRQNTLQPNRRFIARAFWVTVIALVAFYPLYAIVKNELFEGPGHVSLLWAIQWQLFDRPGSGSILTPGSGTQSFFASWIGEDPFLLLGGITAALGCLAVPRMRPIAFLLLLQVAMLARNGYLPYAYVTAMLPFCALAIAGLLDRLAGVTTRGWRPTLQTATTAVLAAALIGLPFAWSTGWHEAFTFDGSTPSQQATAWALRNIPAGAVIVTDDNTWVDMARAGRNPVPIWFYKVDLDPAVAKELPLGRRSIDYIVNVNLGAGGDPTLPIVTDALHNSTVVATFGDGSVTIRKVHH